MAAAIPTLNEITYGVASRIPYYREGKQSHNVHPGTPEAESLFEQYTKQIAESANNVSLPLVVSDDKTQRAPFLACVMLG